MAGVSVTNSHCRLPYDVAHYHRHEASQRVAFGRRHHNEVPSPLLFCCCPNVPLPSILLNTVFLSMMVAVVASNQRRSSSLLRIFNSQALPGLSLCHHLFHRESLVFFIGSSCDDKIAKEEL
ncbi:hypothetical protein HN51_007709 [Arachis hypogaea]